MNNSGVFEQFTMFNFKQITSDILYWDNALSYSDELTKFIELVDKDEESYSRITKWENEIKTANIDSLKESTGDHLVDKRTLYIMNSLSMAFEMCFKEYCKLKDIDQNKYSLGLNNILIKRNNIDLPIDTNNVEFVIIAYLNNNYDGGEISLLTHNISLKPKSASVLIVSAKELNNYILDDVTGSRYVASVVVYKNIMEVKGE